MRVYSNYYHDRFNSSEVQKVNRNRRTKQHTEIHWDGQLKKKTSPFPEGAKSGKIWFDQTNSDYYEKFTSIVDEMKGLNTNEKENLKAAIERAIKRNPHDFPAIMTADKANMYHIQTKEKLDLVVEQMVPEQYEKEIKQMANEYTEQQLREVIQFEKKFQAYSYNKYKGSSGYAELVKDAKQALDQIENGEHRIQKEQQQFKALFSAVGTNPEHFQNQYQEALEGYKENQRETYGVHLDEDRVNRNIELLRKDWNEFVRSVPELKRFAVSTEEQPVIDEKI